LKISSKSFARDLDKARKLMPSNNNASPCFCTALIVCTIMWGSFADSCIGQESFLPKLIKQCQPKMVKIIGAGAGRVDGYASGIIVGAEGTILTSQGVFLDGSQVRVELSDGQSHPATILRRNRTLQLALLKIEADRQLEHFKLSDRRIGEKGDWVLALSNAFKVANQSEPMSAMIGIISLRSTIEARLNERDVAYQGPLVLIDAITSNPGASGGAVVNTKGQLVGMIGKLINSSETNTRINYAVPNATLKQFVDDKIDQTDSAVATADGGGDSLGQADLGIVVFSVGSRNDPAYVDRVRRGTPAARLRIKPDDLIVALDGSQIGTVKEYEKVVSRLVPGVEVSIVFKRGSELMRMQITPRKKK
jgi:serine protease Do